MGYLTYGTDAANMLFHVVNERHRRIAPMIFTTNKALKAWGRVLHDEDLAQGQNFPGNTVPTANYNFIIQPSIDGESACG